MKILTILFLCLFSFSSQNIQAGFWCEDLLQEVYIVESTSTRQIGYGEGKEHTWEYANYFYDLAADQGDTVKINCHTFRGDADTYGGGCFLINNICRCYDFNSEYSPYKYYTRSANFGDIGCSITLGRSRVPDGVYSYQFTIPIDAGGITCPTKTLIFLHSTNNDVVLSNQITANFGIKNVYTSITGNFDYFKLNGQKINENTRFKLLNTVLSFYSENYGKIGVIFRNFGTIGNKDCTLNIRVCHPRCLGCIDADTNENNHHCTKCKSDYYPSEDNNNCNTEEEMIGSNYYFDNDAKMFKRCYKSCATCKAKSTENQHNCIICADSYHFLVNENGKCLNEAEKPINTYLDLSDNTYKYCYERCRKCSLKGSITNNNCDECAKDGNNNYIYHFLEHENGRCITEEEKPINTYLDLSDNTYKYCYERCRKCSLKGDISNNNCDECAIDDNDKYIYHFLENAKGKCITEKEKPSNTYFDSDDNTFKYCFNRCALCDVKGDKDNNNCKECAKDSDNNYLYHFLHDAIGKCINEAEKPLNTYLELATNTYELCYDRCRSCSKKSDIVNNNCDECAKDNNGNYIYHFLENAEGKCITEKEKPSNTYFDSNENTYKYCYERCSLCNKKGDKKDNNCDECAKDNNGNYLYHFLHDTKGICLNETEKPLNTYLDLESNTYELCYQKCSSCDKKGDLSNNNCKECLKDNNGNYIYHFIYNNEGKCVNEYERMH